MNYSVYSVWQPISRAPLTVTAVLLLTALVLRSVYRARRTAHIPGLRYGSIPGTRSWVGAWHWLRDPEGVLREGCEKYPNGCFKVATLTGENIVVNGAERLQEYLTAPDSVLNVQDAINVGIQFQWTMGPGVYHRPYHIPLVRKELSQNVGRVLPMMAEEVAGLLQKGVGEPTEWKEVAIHELVVDMIAKVGNLALGGTPLAHNQRYIDAAIQYTMDLMLSAEILRPLPVWAKEIAVFLTPAYRSKKRCEGMVGEYIQQRLDATDSGKVERQDMLQWMIDTAPAVERTMPQLNERLLALQVAAIHTTTMTLTAAIYTLCSEPETYLEQLRDEVKHHCPDQVTKEGLDSLTKLDSYLRECGRTDPIGTLASGRYARSDFIFKDGTIIPKGYIVSGNVPMLHKMLSTEDSQFDGFRYSKLAEEGKKQPQFVSTSSEYLNFGLGRQVYKNSMAETSADEDTHRCLVMHVQAASSLLQRSSSF
ncbi:hypothetical protein LTR17_020287 [Elasticomyces elasticus]|nr:hypothetical protein LTR17_020287 [Elasticomyces elasticus]